MAALGRLSLVPASGSATRALACGRGAATVLDRFPAAMDLALMRHAESIANAEQRLQGRLDVPLSALGEAQSRRAASAFHARGWRPERVYCSCQQRTAATYAPLAELSGWPAAQPLAVLDEIGAGRLEGKSRVDIVASEKDFATRPLSELGDFARYGGESYEQVQRRVQAIKQRLREDASAGISRALLVGHGGLLKQLIKALVCEPAPRSWLVHMGNGCLVELTLDERMGRWGGELRSWLPLEVWAPLAAAP